MKVWRLVSSIGLLLLGVSAFAESQLIARLAPTAVPKTIATLAGVILRDQVPNAPFALFAAPVGMSAATVRARLQATAGVVWVEDNAEAGAPENQSVHGNPTSKGSSLSVIGGRSNLIALNTTMLSQVNWSSGLADSAGRTVKIAILDTGLSRKQPALWAKVDASYDALANEIKGAGSSRSTADDAPGKIDSNKNGIFDEAVGHGTMIAGIIDQVAPKVRFVIARVADSDGQASAWTLVKGLSFAVNNGAEIANISMGSPNQIAAMSDVIEWAEGRGLLPVVAIGNGDEGSAWFPARLSKVLCVAGLDSNSAKADFSNWDGGCDSSAPSVNISSQWWDGTLGVWSGTSFAAPFVSGALADCLRRVGPQSPKNLIDIANKSGIKIDSLNRNYKGKLGTLLDIQHLNSMLVHP